MLRTKTKIGEITVFARGAIKRQSEIAAHPNYGITCGELGTTNGSIVEVAKRIVLLCRSIKSMREDLDDPSYDLKVRIDERDVDPRTVSEETIFAILAARYTTVTKETGSAASQTCF